MQHRRKLLNPIGFLLIYLSSSSKNEFANVLRSEAARRVVFD